MTTDGRLTTLLVERLARYRREPLPEEAWQVAVQCVLDWCGCAIAGADEPAARLLRDELILDGTRGGPCSLVAGGGIRTSAPDAALINGTASHALDYDDVNARMMGHPTVAIWPAVLAVAELEGSSGEQALRAFIAGYETAAIVGAMICPPHYLAGFHATATIGTLAAAAAAGVLMDLPAGQMHIALGLAATQAAGLKSMFGTMAKPFHAGRAAAGGLLAARLARRGYSAHAAVLDDDQGFIAVLGCGTQAMSSPWLPEPGEELRNNLFKQHAMCLETHSTFEATRATMLEHGFCVDDVRSVEVHVTAGHLKVCNILDPQTGLESKFSLRHVVAMALTDAPTRNPDFFTDANADRPELRALRERVTVHGDVPGPTTFVRIKLRSGTSHESAYNIRLPAADLDAQGERLRQKFLALSERWMGPPDARALEGAIMALREAPDLGFLDRLALAAPPRNRRRR